VIPPVLFSSIPGSFRCIVVRGSEWILLIYPAMRVYSYSSMEKKGLMWLFLASLSNISLLNGMSYGRAWPRLTLTTYCPRRWFWFFFALSFLAVDVLLMLIFFAFLTAFAQSFAFDLCLFAGYQHMDSRVVYVYLPVLLGDMILIHLLRCTSYNELISQWPKRTQVGIIYSSRCFKSTS
jgi:hypothetical protein